MSLEGKKLIDNLTVVNSKMHDMNYTGINEDGNTYSCFSDNNLYPLPSAKKGNLLAFALEMNYYVVARHILLNNDEYNYDLDRVMIDEKGNEYGAKEAYLYSLDYYEEEKEFDDILNSIDRRKFSNLKDALFFLRRPELYSRITRLERNIESSYEIGNLLDKAKTLKK